MIPTVILVGLLFGRWWAVPCPWWQWVGRFYCSPRPRSESRRFQPRPRSASRTSPSGYSPTRPWHGHCGPSGKRSQRQRSGRGDRIWRARGLRSYTRARLSDLARSCTTSSSAKATFDPQPTLAPTRTCTYVSRFGSTATTRRRTALGWRRTEPLHLRPRGRSALGGALPKQAGGAIALGCRGAARTRGSPLDLFALPQSSTTCEHTVRYVLVALVTVHCT